jgi:multiple sugar transport system substrate-binding protein
MTMDSNRRRGCRLATWAAAFALLVAACGSGDEGNESEESGPVELTLLDHQKPRVDLLKQLLPEFEQAMADQGKQITVELLEGPAPDDQFTTKLTLDFSSGNAADVSSFGAADAVDYAASGFLLDLTDRVDAWDGWEHFYQRLRDEQEQADGSVYAIPREATIQQLFYRKDVLEREGIPTEQPQSWQELLERMQRATTAIGAPALLFPAGTAWGGGTFGEGFIHLMLGTDSPLYQDGKWVVRSPGLTEVLSFYEQMTTTGVLPVQPLLNPEPWVPTKYQAFPEGELVATTCGTWCWNFDWGPSGAAPIEDIFNKVATWEFPTAAGGETFVWGASGWVWGIAEQTEHPDEAWELVKWLAGGEAMASNAVTVGAASPRDDLADVAPYSDYEYLIAAEQQLANARSFTNPEGVDKMAQAVGEVTEAIITGEASAEEAADMLADRATELLGEENVMEL